MSHCHCHLGVPPREQDTYPCSPSRNPPNLHHPIQSQLASCPGTCPLCSQPHPGIFQCHSQQCSLFEEDVADIEEVLSLASQLRHPDRGPEAQDTITSMLMERLCLIQCQNATYKGPLSHRGHKGTAEEELRLRCHFPSSAGYINLTNLLLNQEPPLGPMYSHTTPP